MAEDIGTNPFSAQPADRRDFVGRERELRTLQRRLVEVADGNSCAAAIPAETGFGKSSMLEQVRRFADEMSILPVVSTRARSTEASPAAMPISFRKVVRTLQRSLDEAADERDFARFDIVKPDWLQGANTLTQADWIEILEDGVLGVIKRTPLNSVLIGLDETQTLDAEALAQLKAIIQGQKGVGVVLSWRLYEDYAESATLAYTQAIGQLAREIDSDGGALRTFTETVVPASPFRDTAEALKCIDVRLSRVSGTITDEVKDEIVRASGLKPSTIIGLCHHAYDNALKREEAAPVVTAEDFEAAIAIKFEEQCRAAASVIGRQSDEGLQVMKAAIACGPSASVDQICAKIRQRTGRSEPQLELLVRSELISIAKACQSGGIRFDITSDDVEVSSPFLYFVFRSVLAK